MNFEKEFKATVIDYFIKEYERGRTPNPCLACNDYMKFRFLLNKALALGATAVGIGRPYGYGAVLGGTAGIEFVLSCLLAEADLTMGLNGYAGIAELTREVLLRC